jgi:N-acetylglutamate synthase-like GNAT family acetyltransferase
MNNFKIFQIKKKNFKLINFLKTIKDKNFLINKSFNNTPWIHFKNPNFNFYKVEIKKKIVGIVVIIKLRLNTHLQFLYISKNYRSKGLGYEILNKLLPKKIFITVHVPKKLSNRTQKFYQKNGFKLSNLDEKHKLIKYWINRCIKFDSKTFIEKKLLYKNLFKK